MDQSQNDENLQAVLDSLSVSNIPQPPPATPPVPVPSSDPLDIDSLYIDAFNRIKNSIDNNNEILKEAAEATKMAGDTAWMEAYSNVAKSNSEMLKNLTSLITERDKIKTAERLKEKDFVVKKELVKMKQDAIPKGGSAANLPNGNVTQNNYFVTANRETMFNALFGKPEQKQKAQQEIKEINDLVIEGEVVAP